MKLYTNESQTANLIELGFEKPRSVSRCEMDLDMQIIPYRDYSIGELLSFLHDRIIPIELHYEKGGFGYFRLTLKVWIDGMWCTILDKQDIEYIDFLFEGLVKLKEEGVI